MVGISREHELEWHRRIAGVAPHTDLGDLHATIDAATVRVSGPQGIAAIRVIDDFVTPDPASFAARALVFPIGRVVVFRLLVTPCTSVRTPARIQAESTFSETGLAGQPGSLALNVQHLGPTSVRNGALLFETPRGRMNYATGSTPYAVDRPELTDTFGVALPIGLVPELESALVERPAGLLPDSTITAAAEAFLSMFLLRRLTGGEVGAVADEEAALVALVRATLVPVLDVPRATVSQTRDPDVVRRASEEYIDRNFADPEFAVIDLARHLGMSRRQLYRYFDEGGLAARLARRRVEEARRLIEGDPAENLDVVARQVGFSGVDRLRAHFVRSFGMSPSAFRSAASSGLPADDVP